AQECQRQGDPGPVPHRVEGGLAIGAGAKYPADAEAKLLNSRRRRQMLGIRVHKIAVAIKSIYQRVNISEYNNNGKQREDHYIGLFSEKHTKHGMPIGIPRSGDLLYRGGILGDLSKKLLIRQPRVIKSDHILLNHSHLLSPRFGS